MSRLAQRLRQTLMEDGGGAEYALTELLTSELNVLFRQYMNVDNIMLSFDDKGISIRIDGSGLIKVGRKLD